MESHSGISDTDCPECGRSFPTELVQWMKLLQVNHNTKERSTEMRRMCPICARVWHNAIHHLPMDRQFPPRMIVAARMYDKAMDHLIRTGQKLDIWPKVPH